MPRPEIGKKGAKAPGLKPCPFCGGPAKYECGNYVHDVFCSNEDCLIRPQASIYWGDTLKQIRLKTSWRIEGTKDDVIRIWNERAQC